MPVPKNGNVFYVYQLVDPRNGEVFYVGKGKGYRKNAHVRDAKFWRGHNVSKADRIRDILRSGHEVAVEIIEDGLSEGRAYQLERHTIQGFPSGQLTNVSPGTVTTFERYVLECAGYLVSMRTEREWMVHFTRSRGTYPTATEYKIYRAVRDRMFRDFACRLICMKRDGIKVPLVAIETLVVMRKRHGKGIEQEAAHKG
jgi:hypothetical protein